MKLNCLYFIIFLQIGARCVQSLSTVAIAKSRKVTVEDRPHCGTARDEEKYNNFIPALASAKNVLETPTTYEEAAQILDECALKEKSCERLYEAARLLEKKANQYYPQISDREELWDRAQGSWKLVLSTGNGKGREFHPPTYLLPFSFAMIAGEYFGNGFGLNPNIIFVSVLQKHYFNPKIRYMVVCVQDIYVAGQKATNFVPDFLKNAINLGKTPDDFQKNKMKAPAFCLIAATENALIARGNQSGALAIWKRLPCDMKPVAYKDL